jgi:hypothetical protein
VTRTRKMIIVLALVITPNALRAGSIPWTYSTTVATNGNAAWQAAFPTHVLAGSRIDAEYTAEVLGASGSAEGSRIVVAGEARPGASLSPDNPLLRSGGYAIEFNFLFDIQDAASGQRGSAGFTGVVGEAYNVDPDNPRIVLSRSESIFAHDPVGDSPWLATTTLRLGENDYRVDLKEREDGSGSAFIDAHVRVQAVHETPEPATIALGALGLAGVLCGRLRRSA